MTECLNIIIETKSCYFLFTCLFVCPFLFFFYTKLFFLTLCGADPWTIRALVCVCILIDIQINLLPGSVAIRQSWSLLLDIFVFCFILLISIKYFRGLTLMFTIGSHLSLSLSLSLSIYLSIYLEREREREREREKDRQIDRQADFLT